jgi:hypothetical protein
MQERLKEIKTRKERKTKIDRDTIDLVDDVIDG